MPVYINMVNNYSNQISMTSKKIFLASTSPRRIKILKNIGLKFQSVPSNYTEEMDLDLAPEELAKHLAEQKVRDVAKEYKGIIIGADTFIVLDGRLLGKPHTKDKAQEILKQISGKALKVISGVAIMDTKRKNVISESLATKVFIKKLSKEEIENYIKTNEPLDKAGAFGIQGKGAVFVEKIEGDYYNVVGLPLNLLYRMLSDIRVNIWEE